MALPHFIPPMLAVPGSPFDSDEYYFEVKWDGYRALLFREGGKYRLMSRNAVDLTGRFPELKFLSRIQKGTVLDGEIVALVDGRPDFESLGPGRGAAHTVIIYVAFDILYKNYASLITQPLLKRKEELEKIISPHLQERLVLNEHIETNGTKFFDAVVERGLEGVMAKYKRGLYYPGRREETWKKIKRSREIFCVIIGYTPDESGAGFKSLMLAADRNGVLTYAGKVGTGFSRRLREELFPTMRRLVVDMPIIPCPESGVWVKPEIFCKIRYAEFTGAGVLRAAVFESLVA